MRTRRTTTRHRRPSAARRALAFTLRLALSFGYLMLSAMLLLFGFIVGWDADPGRPVVGALMIAAGLAVFVLGPRAVRRITGKDPIDPPPYVLP